MGHRPMYCSNDNTDDCVNFDDRVKIFLFFVRFYNYKFEHMTTQVRKGLPFIAKFGLEDLFYNHGVDG